MNNFFKKISIFTTLILLQTNTLAFSATFTKEISTSELYKSEALQLITQLNSNKVIESSIPLYNSEDSESYILFDLNDGYIIVDELTDQIAEFSLTEDNKYFTDSNKHYIYGGPNCLYQQDNTTYTNLVDYKEQCDNSTIRKNINKKIDHFRNNVLKNQMNNPKLLNTNVKASDRKISESKYYSIKLVGTMPNLSYNPNGICGSCAAANVLTYLSWNAGSSYVPSEYRNPSFDGVALIKSLVPYIDGPDALDLNNHGGSVSTALQSGLQKYVSEKIPYNISVDLYDLRENRKPSVSKINEGYPYILGLFAADGNSYGNHWVMATGYLSNNPSTSTTSPAYYLVVDGWGNKDVYINPSWTDYMIAV